MDWRRRVFLSGAFVGGLGALDCAAQTHTPRGRGDPEETSSLVATEGSGIIDENLVRTAREVGHLLSEAADVLIRPQFTAKGNYLIVPGSEVLFNYQGKIFGMPWVTTVPLMFYNKDLWARHGLPAPKSDWTWADALAGAEQLALVREGRSEGRWREAERAIDRVERRFGRGAATPAALLAPARERGPRPAQPAPSPRPSGPGE